MDKAKPRALIIDDSKEDRDMIAAFISDEYHSDHAANGAEALELIDRNAYNCILLDIEFEDGADGFAILEKLGRKCGEIPVVMVTKHNDIDRIIRAVRLGAIHYVHKDVLAMSLKVAMEKASREAALRRARQMSWRNPPGILSEFIGTSNIAARIRAEIEQAAKTSEPVLITGETGAGKDHVADMIHRLSARKDSPFVELICGERPSSLIADDLFGHVPGSHTDSKRYRPGFIESANLGTVFINEIGDVDTNIQGQLLRVAEKKTYSKLGSEEEQYADVRFIFATRKNVGAMLREGTFREDLYYRISVHEIHIPPLRERREDIPVLAEYFLKEAAEEWERPPITVSSDVLEALADYEWRGNVRELRMTIKKAIISLEGNHLLFRDIMNRPSRADTSVPLREACDRFKEDYLRNLMIKCDRKVSFVAARAGMTERSVYSLIKKFNIR